MPYLLDTNILSSLLRHPKGAISARIARLGIDSVRTSIIVAAEMRFGALRRRSVKLSADIEGLFERLAVLPFEAPADVYYAQLRADLEAVGTPIGANDLLIAAHALALGCTLVTDNEREFLRVPGLTIENWLR